MEGEVSAASETFAGQGWASFLPLPASRGVCPLSCSWLPATAVCPLSALFPRGFAPSRDLLLCASLLLEGNRPSRPRGPPCSHATSPYLTKRINLQRPSFQIRSHSQVPGVGLEHIFLGGALQPTARAGGDGQETGKQGRRQAGLLKRSSGDGWPWQR